jgi:hypothetical protein
VLDYTKSSRFHPHFSYNSNKVEVWGTNLDNSLIYPERQDSNVISGGMFVGLTYTLSRNNDR